MGAHLIGLVASAHAVVQCRSGDGTTAVVPETGGVACPREANTERNDMGLVARLLRKGRGSEGKEPRISRLQAITRERTRREVIAMALRDTLKGHGLPAGCIGADVLPGFASSGCSGMHIQLVYRAREPGLLAYAVFLEQAVQARLERLDPSSPGWIAGLSWRFEPEDRSAWPKPPTAARGGADVAPSRARAQPAVALEEVLHVRDGAFARSGRGDMVPATAFSPTLPMQA